MSVVGLLYLFGRLFFGGYIFSYDFVEVVLICCVGWSVIIVVDLSGFFEECFFLIIDLVVCDCCWC